MDGVCESCSGSIEPQLLDYDQTTCGGCQIAAVRETSGDVLTVDHLVFLLKGQIEEVEDDS